MYKRPDNIVKLAPYLYSVEYNELDYHAGDLYFKKYKAPTGLCSAVINGNIIGRNYDWYYDERSTFVTTTSACNGRHGVIGVCSAPSDLTPAIIDSGADSESYAIIPFLLLDGMNDAGLFCEINVCATGDKGYTTGTNPEGEDLFAAMIPRFVLDYADSVDEAIRLLQTRNIFAAGSEAMTAEFHFLLADKKKVICLEFVENRVTIIDRFVDNKPIITNFYLDGYDGSRASLTPYAMGIERQAILTAGFDAATSMPSMQALMDRVAYTRAYSPLEDPVWYSEFCGQYEEFGDLTKDSPPEAYAGILAFVREQYASRSRATALTWQTVHSTVYDRERFKMVVIPQESGVAYSFDLLHPDPAVTIGTRRLELSSKFRRILGSSNVYFQPPTNERMRYPCIVYSRSSPGITYADDNTYSYTQCYDGIFITDDPDSYIPIALQHAFRMFSLGKPYVSDNLNHHPFKLYY